MGGMSGMGGMGGAGGLDLASLAAHPQIQQLREMVRQNPALIQALIQQLAQQNPALAQHLANNPEALLQLLGVGDGDDDGGTEGEIPPGAQTISVTAEEREAIARVSLLRACSCHF
jgi:UV excision repair protein RAD23